MLTSPADGQHPTSLDLSAPIDVYSDWIDAANEVQVPARDDDDD